MWIKVGTIGNIIAIGDYKISNDERIDIPHSYVNDWSLVIEQVTEEDIGQYICQVNTEPQIAKKIFLQVLLPPKIIEEKTTINPNPVVEGDVLTLNCFVDGLPIPKVSWYFRKKVASSHANENELVFNYDKFSHYLNNGVGSAASMIPIQEGNVLIIENVGRNYSGYFECIANNSVPPAASRKMKVTVECKNFCLFVLLLRIINFHAVPLFFLVSPEVYIETNKFEEKVGADARFECKIVANPLINHYWIKDGRVIENSVDFEFKYEDRVNNRDSQNKYEITINNNNNDFITISSLLIRVNLFIILRMADKYLRFYVSL